MSAPETPAPLTPADITDLLGDGWEHSQDRYSHMWDRQDSIASVVLPNADAVAVTVYEASGWPWQVPATLAPVKFAAVLALAGLIPGQVSVTQPDDDTQTCSRCGDSVHYLSSTGLCDGCEAEPHRPRVCSCSMETRPTGADPCREWVTSIACVGCAPLFDPSLLTEVVDRDVSAIQPCHECNGEGRFIDPETGAVVEDCTCTCHGSGVVDR